MTRRANCAVLLLVLAGLCGCAPPAAIRVAANERPFDFARDSFDFVNEVEWNYRIDPVTGAMRHDGANLEAEYTQRCFVVSRSVRQFFQFARFDPQLPRAGEAEYRALIAQVLAHDPRETAPVERVVIPGYADLRSFSHDWEHLLKSDLGGRVQSFWQRGNWRMIWPFSRRHQEGTAQALAEEIRARRPPVVHLADFPEMQINHAVLLFGVSEGRDQLRFDVYDPNVNSHPLWLVFDRSSGRFHFAPSHYFAGGAVNVYEVYRSAAY